MEAMRHHCSGLVLQQRKDPDPPDPPDPDLLVQIQQLEQERTGLMEWVGVDLEQCI